MGLDNKPPPKVLTAPLPTEKINISHWRNPEFIDFTGMRFKDILVIGRVAPSVTGMHGGWLCRCSCGNYLTRKAKALRLMRDNANSPLYCCDVCADYYMLDRGQPVGEK